MGIPLYKEIAQQIITQIEQGQYTENQKLPSERQLAMDYNVSRFTVHSAIQFLEEQAYVYTIHGSGTFVSPKNVYINLNAFYSFDAETTKYDGPITNKILATNSIASPPHISHKMHCPVDTQLQQLIRLRYSHKTPIIFQTTYLPYAKFPHIDAQTLVQTPLYEYLATQYNTTFTKGKEYIQAYIPTQQEQKFLQIKDYIPCLKVERFSIVENQIIEYTISIIRGDKYSFEINL